MNKHSQDPPPPPPLGGLAGKGAYNVLNTTLLVIRGLALSILVARILGPDLQGSYSFLLYVVQLAVQVVNLGYPNTIIRFVAQRHALSDKTGVSSVVAYVVKRELLLGVLATTGLFLLSHPLAGHSSQDIPVCLFLIAALAILPDSLTVVYEASFEGLLAYRSLLRINLVLLPLSFTAAAVILLSGGGVLGLVLLKVFLAIVRVLVYRRTLVSTLPPPGTLPHELAIDISHYARSLAAIFFFDTVVWQRSEVFFLYFFHSRAEVAFYDIAYMVVGVAMRIVPEKLADILFPVFSGLEGRGDREASKAHYRKSTRLLFAISLCIAVGVYAYAPLLVSLVYGNAYLPVSGAIRIFCIAAPILIIARATAYLLYAAGWQGFNVRLAGAAAVVNIILDFLLIPRHGIIGAALANSITQILSVIVLVTYVLRRTGVTLPWSAFTKTLVAGAIQMAVLRGAQTMLQGWLLLVLGTALSVLAYGATLVVSNVISAEERAQAIAALCHFRKENRSSSMHGT